MILVNAVINHLVTTKEIETEIKKKKLKSTNIHIFFKHALFSAQPQNAYFKPKKNSPLRGPPNFDTISCKLKFYEYFHTFHLNVLQI